MAVDLKDLTMEQLMLGLPYLATEGMEGRYVYNLELADVDGTRVKNDKYFVIADNGAIEYGEGHTDDPDATLFTINQGGVDTLIAFQIHGLKAATNAMILGYIFASNIKKAEAWFKILKVGEDEVKEALGKAGIEVGSTDLDIYAELMI
jgi:hypothetical protein